MYKSLDTISLKALNQFNDNTMVSHLGIEFTEVSKDSVIAKMPVDQRTIQPFGILHGGANVTLAETVGSVAGNLLLDDDHFCMGLDINANHTHQVRFNENKPIQYVYGEGKPLHLGRSTQVWEILIRNNEDKLCCVSRLTLYIGKKIVIDN